MNRHLGFLLVLVACTAVAAQAGPSGDLQSLSGTLKEAIKSTSRYYLELDGMSGTMSLSGEALAAFKPGDRVWVDGVIRTRLRVRPSNAEPDGIPEQLQQQQPDHWEVLMDVRAARKIACPFDLPCSESDAAPREIPAVIDSAFDPAIGTEYALGGGWLYHPARDDGPGPPEADDSRAWSLGNEFVYRTALAREYSVPAAMTGSASAGWYRTEFTGKGGRPRLVVEVNLERRVVRLPLPAGQ
jgi:hypothetical protein